MNTKNSTHEVRNGVTVAWLVDQLTHNHQNHTLLGSNPASVVARSISTPTSFLKLICELERFFFC